MPDEFLLRNIDNQDVWVSEAENLEIREDTHVRIRIANIQLQPEKLVRCLATSLCCRLCCACFMQALQCIGHLLHEWARMDCIVLHV